MLLEAKDACVVSIEIDGRQRYLFESDKLKEMLGASLLMRESAEFARCCFADEAVHLFQPVSGEVRAWCRNESEHRSALLNGAWRLRQWLDQRGIDHTCVFLEIDARHFTIDAEPQSSRVADSVDIASRPDLGWVQRLLTRLAAERKSARHEADARPSCSLFTPCQIHGADYANRWANSAGSTDARRELVGDRAAAKLEHWMSARDQFYRELCVEGDDDFDSAGLSFNDFADQLDDEQASDSYIAFLCADGDGIGAVLSELDWNAAEWRDGRAPWDRNRSFVEALDRVTSEAFQTSMRQYVETPEGGTSINVPLLPQLVGGDDLWSVARRDVALPFACTFATEFAERVAAAPDLNKALDIVATAAPRPVITMSIGVSFDKAGHPAFAQARAAEDLLNGSAKRLRKGTLWSRGGQSRTEACIDWHWIDSRFSENVLESRLQGWSYRDDDGRRVMTLTSRPWTVSECAGLLELAHGLHVSPSSQAPPRRKLEELEDILRRGYSLSLVAWEVWWSGLRPPERKTMQALRDNLAGLGILLNDDGSPVLGFPSPWRTVAAFDPGNGATGEAWTYCDTPLLDLLGLRDVAERGRGRSTTSQLTETVDDQADA